MKEISAFLLTILMVISLAAYGGKSETTEETASDAGDTTDAASTEINMSYTNSVLLQALLISLVEEAGVSPEDITVYDVSRLFPDHPVREKSLWLIH